MGAGGGAPRDRVYMAHSRGLRARAKSAEDRAAFPHAARTNHLRTDMDIRFGQVEGRLTKLDAKIDATLAKQIAANIASMLAMTSARPQ